MITLNHYLVLSAILFAIGTAGVFLRRNVITLLLSIEIMMYMAEPADSEPRPAVGAVPFLALVASTIALFYLGILPTRVINLAASSVSTIF